MTKSDLRARFARAGQIQAVDRVDGHFAADIVLRPIDRDAGIDSINAALALARRGVTMLKGKRAMEAVMDHGEATLHVPGAEDWRTLAHELRAANLRISLIAKPNEQALNIAALRERLRLSQAAFAARYGLELDSVQNWEQGRPISGHAYRYLRAIAADPEGAARAQEEDIQAA